MMVNFVIIRGHSTIFFAPKLHVILYNFFTAVITPIGVGR